jgi:S-adenosyl-L-methionine hydrolase (adenosine-forming)
MDPVITLTTDFGAAGPFVGVMKAMIWRHAPDARIIDLTHQVAPCDPGEAGFWLERSYRHFPPGSVHVAVVDPGVGTARPILACEHDGHRFLAPDNGILPMVAPAGVALHALADDWAGRRDWPPPSRTFHGRDIFAPLAAAFLAGRAAPADIGPPHGGAVAAAVPAARREQGVVTGKVVAIDNWGNLITNIDAGLLAGLAEPRVGIGHRDVRLFPTYGEAPPGALLALVNSFGVVEVAWREGNAAQLLQLGRGAEVSVAAGSRTPA